MLYLLLVVVVGCFGNHYKHTCSNEFLVVLPSKSDVTYSDNSIKTTGAPFEELLTGLRKLHLKGFRQVFASPEGSKEWGLHPTFKMTNRHLHPYWQRHSDLNELYRMIDRMRHLLTDEPTTRNPISLEHLAEDDLEHYTGILLAGGEATLEDLHKNSHLGRVIRHFHEQKKPIIAIGHGVGALESTYEPNKPWIFSGYQMTGISQVEQKRGHENAKLRFFVSDRLKELGASWSESADPERRTPHVIRDRNLLTGEGLWSTHEWGNAMEKMLNEYCPNRPGLPVKQNRHRPQPENLYRKRWE